MDECDALGGVKDRLIENPLERRFDILKLACETSASDTKAVYATPKDLRTGQDAYPGFSFGSETQWMMQEGTLANAFAVPIFQNLVFDNLAYDTAAFNW